MESDSASKRLSSTSALKRLVASYVAAIATLAGAIWFELPEWIATVLLGVALALTLFVAVSTGRTVARVLASMPYRKRPSITGRGAGMLSLVVLALIPLAIAKFVYPRSWPTSVEDAVAVLRDQLDAESARNLAYMGYDDLAGLQDTLGVSLRTQFGLNTRNFRLAYDCDAEYINPQTCSSIIISRLWKKVRAELPEAERVRLEELESGMDRVRLGSKQFEGVPLQELVAFLNDAIRAQLPQGAQFTIVHNPRQASERVSTSWHAVGTISLREALGVLTAGGQWRVRKDPPQLVIERS